MSDASPDTGSTNRLNPRVVVIWFLNVVFLALFVGAATFVAVRFGPFDLAAGLAPPVAFGLLVLVLGGAHSVARYRSWRYVVQPDAIYLERGVLTRTRTVVPFVRIQHVDSSRSPAQRVLGLASTVVYTAGTRGADVTVPGLTAADAADLQERLKRLAIRAEGEDAV